MYPGVGSHTGTQPAIGTVREMSLDFFAGDDAERNVILKTALVQKFRSIENSGTVRFEPDVTCLVGKNESGKTAFLDMPEPILAFRRDHDGQALTAVFNLSRTPLSVAVAGDTGLSGPVNATLEGGTLHLPANGFA